MNMSLSQKQKQAHKLMMTPQLRQSIELLQFNALELRDFLTKKSLENPLLELDEFGSHDFDTRGGRNPIDAISETIANPLSLTSALLEQLSFSVLDVDTRQLADFMIRSLDDDGYLHENSNDLANLFSTATQKVEEALAVIQSFEPAGIGARNLQECLLLQLQHAPLANSLEIKIVTDYFDLLVERKLARLSKELDTSIANIQESVDKILSLEPKPGAKFHQRLVHYIIPDLTISTKSGQTTVRLNDLSFPTIQINRTYEELLKSGTSDIHQYLTEKHTELTWLTKGLTQRKATIMSIMKEILVKQNLFFQTGPSALKPLSMKVLAHSLGIHESTVSRAIKNKYIQTDFGLFELKTFFTNSVNSQKDQSAAQIKHIIQNLLNAEDKKKPLSDQKISDLLKQQGISASRRVITKYREQLNIPNSSARKRY